MVEKMVRNVYMFLFRKGEINHTIKLPLTTIDSNKVYTLPGKAHMNNLARYLNHCIELNKRLQNEYQNKHTFDLSTKKRTCK